MIEDTKILEELRKTNDILLSILEAIQQGSTGNETKRASGSRNNARNALSDEEKQELEFEIDLDWWYMNYGEENLPAKYMCMSMGVPQPGTNPYNKDESDYIFHRLLDFEHEENEQGTHVFKYLGKVWCRREKNSFNCFAFVPIKESA